MIKINNLKLKINYSQNDVKHLIAKSLNINEQEILNFIVLKKSIDARRKPNIFYVLNVGVNIKNEEHFKHLKFEYDNTGIHYNKSVLKLETKPVVVGFGPSGMFLALALSQMGLNPIVLEQGACVDKRIKDVEDFWQNKVLNPYSNVQFGEGGAGTFSDGKLNTNINNRYCAKVINTFVEHGAPSEIAIEAKPHIGSDKLVNVVKNIRQKIIELGGTVLFNTTLTNINVNKGCVCGVEAKNVETNEILNINTKHLFLAVGHSAIKVYKLLKKLNVCLQPKPFAMGVRIEQNQNEINVSQYGKTYKNLPNADYKLVTHLNNGRSVFTFCMCPGGTVVNSASEEGTVVTNGMSNFARNGSNANSAVLVNVTPSDFKTRDVLSGVEFQRHYEKLAFELGGANYACPAQSVGEFLNKKQTSLKVKPTLAVKMCDLSKCLPPFVSESLRLALPILNGKLKHFADDGNLLIGIESRSSSPVTIVRDKNFESNVKGLFPCGEGAGYAGGIVTSAVDGVKAAEAFLAKLQENQ